MGAVLPWERPSAFLIPLYIPLMFPVMAVVCVSWLSCVQYYFSHLAVCWTLLVTALIIYRFLSLGDCVYSIRAVCLASMMGRISVDLASNQSWVFGVFFPKVARAVRCAYGVSGEFHTSLRQSLWAVWHRALSRKPPQIVTGDVVVTFCWHQ